MKFNVLLLSLIIFTPLVASQTVYVVFTDFFSDLLEPVFDLIDFLLRQTPDEVPLVTCSSNGDCLDPGTSCCGGVCSPVLTDPLNCGSCGNSCDLVGEVCVLGECTQCGNGVCESELGETCGNCADCACLEGESCREITPGSNVYSCGAVAECGNGYCNIDEGENANNCPSDCQGACEDGVCDSTENCNSCSGDCGGCCGNGSCETQFGETCDVCPSDCHLGDPDVPCCGDGICRNGYNDGCGNCPQDCGNPNCDEDNQNGPLAACPAGGYAIVCNGSGCSADCEYCGFC